MTYLARQVKRSNWEAAPDFADDEVPADNLQRCVKELRTSGNTLSFWECEGTDRDAREEAALAIAGGWKDRPIEGLELAWIRRESLSNDHIRLERTNGLTCIADLREKHVDACHLDLRRLGKVAGHLALAVRGGQQFHMFTRAEIVQLMVRAVRVGRVDRAQLPKVWKEALAESS